jgi:hypothetical protein
VQVKELTITDEAQLSICHYNGITSTTPQPDAYNWSAITKVIILLSLINGFITEMLERKLLQKFSKLTRRGSRGRL